MRWVWTVCCQFRIMSVHILFPLSGTDPKYWSCQLFNPLNAELNPICHLLALLGAHHIFHVSRLRVKLKKNMYCSVMEIHVFFTCLGVIFMYLIFCSLILTPIPFIIQFPMQIIFLLKSEYFKWPTDYLQFKHKLSGNQRRLTVNIESHSMLQSTTQAN